MKTTNILCLILIATGPLAVAEMDRSSSMTDEAIDQSYGASAPDRGAKSQHKALAEWAKEIAASGTKSPSETIPYLGRALVKLSSWNIFQVPERIAVYDSAQTALLAIPGHAEYYRDRILQAQERFKNQGESTTWSDYRDEIGNGFQTLPHLNSPEGVRVLGELLSNHWMPPGNQTAIASERFAPLSESAAVTLPKYPLLDKPFKDPITRHNAINAQAAWQLWYEQIKSGKRTFRFEGDPTEYDLNGPAPGQKLAHISRDRKRDAERDAGRERTSESPVVAEPAAAITPSKSMPVVLLIAGMVLLVSLGWYFLRGRSREGS